MRIDKLKEAVARDEEGIVLPILDPSGEPYTAADGTATTFTILGSQSAARRKAENLISKQILRTGAGGTDPEDLRARRITLAAACVTDCTGWEDEQNKAIPYAPATIKQILGTDLRILVQLEQGIEKHSSFLPPQ
jgi:hypothetical protein